MLSGDKLTRTTAKFLLALFALSCVARAHPRPHKHNSHRQVTKSDLSTRGFHFDRDLIADRVELESQGFEKHVRILLGNQRRQELGFNTSSEDYGNLVAGDIDRDGDVDLIWIGTSARRRAVILINQGEGFFAQAGDNAPYSSELDELFNLGDPPDKRVLKRHRKNSSLTSSTFSDVSSGETSELQVTTVNRLSITRAERKPGRLAFLSNDPKRGPPSILS